MRDFAHQKRVSFFEGGGVLGSRYSQGLWTDFDAKYAKTRGSAQGCAFYNIIIIIIITDLYSAFRSEDTEALDAAQED